VRTPKPVQRTETVRQILARTFLRRSMQMLERLSATASAESLNAALSSPSDVGGVASFLSEMAPLGVDLSTVDPFAESLAKGAVIKQELLERSGGGLTAAQVASALGITRQAVDKRRIRRTLLAVPTGSGDYVYPACQFDSEGVILRFEDVLQSFQIEGPWTRLSVLLAPSPSLRGKSILEALKAGDVERAIAVANAFGEQGA
jgi:hypothetical protein